jgi:tRNA A-37 threonylcarbamoyl transferase component Bud32
MVCARCGHPSSADAGCCPTCGATFAQATAATVLGSIETAGLEPDVTIGAPSRPSTFPPENPLDGTSAATGDAGTGDAATGTSGTGELGAAVARSSGPLKVGQSFGPRYHIIKLLGAGGMGAVYQAWDAELGVAVALKVIRTDHRRRAASVEAERRFKNELLLARQVTHKNVVRIHDLGEIDGIKYITMPYVQGDDLSAVLRANGKLPIARALRLARQIAGGLEAAHDAGVVHRDLKPPNIMISAAGEDEQALIMDFGISASTDEVTEGSIVGTLEYMSPEQGSGQAVDARSDLYAFGVILFELLGGPRSDTSRTGRDRIAAMKQRFADGFPSLRTLDDTIPEPLAALVARCLERDPAARFQATADLCAALAALDDAGELIPIHARISKRMMAALALLVVGLLVGTFVVTRRAILPTKPHDPVSVVIADFQNSTGDPTFDRTLEPMLKLALENAGFISAYDRSGISRSLGVKPPEKLDERAAQELAVKQGLGVVLSGSLERQGSGYGVSVKAVQAVTGNVITSVKNRASDKQQVLGVATKLATAVRKALGDNTSDSAQRFAMEALSATSLDVVREYAAAMDALSRAKYEDARQRFAKAVALDGNFGLGYAGMAITSNNLDKKQDAEKFAKEAVRHLDGMTERERLRTRGNFYLVTSDYQNCVKEYGDMIARYAAEAAARNNLALCSSYLRDMPKAVDQMQQVVKILPNRALYRINLAQYTAYGGDFQMAEQLARTAQAQSPLGLQPLAFAQTGLGQVSQAADSYVQMEKVEDLGPSYTASGLGDLALYEGRLSDAARILAQGAAADLASKDPDRAATKLAALAYTQLLRQQKSAAIAAADKALANSQTVKIRFLAARVYVEAGAGDKARTLAAGLAAELQAEPQAYGKIVDGEAALKNGDAPQAIKSLTEANTLLDTWMGHFDLGRAYLERGAFIQADSELDRCIKRRGEAGSLFLDEEPTFGFFPPVYYYQGRVREALNMAKFADSYRAYLDIRGKSTEDPLLPDVRRRAGR